MDDKSLTLRDRRNMADGVSESALKDLHDQGQLHYRKKNFELALWSFSKAIEIDSKPHLDVLDNRAATYIKLKDFTSALKDGRRMIEQDPLDGRGYLRTGQILQQMTKPDQALQIYELGIRRVPENKETIRHALQDKHNELTSRLAPPKAIDPLQVLPVEVVNMTLGYLKLSQMANLMRVSHFWRDFIVSSPNLWVELDFSGAKRPVSMGTIRQYVKRAKGLCTHVTFRKTDDSHRTILKYIIDRCQRLREISLLSGMAGESLVKNAPSAANLRTISLLPNCSISLDAAHQLLDMCENLERAEFLHIVVPQSQGSDYRTSTDPWAVWKKDMPKLKTLRFDKCRYWGRLHLPLLMLRIPHIRTLSVQGWDIVTDDDTVDFSQLHELEILDLRGINHVDRGRFSITTTHLPSSLIQFYLERAKMWLNPLYRNPWFPTIPPNSPQQILTRHLPQKQHHLPKLALLSIKRVDLDVKNIVTALLQTNEGKLLRLAACSNIDLDLADFVKARCLDRVTHLDFARSFVGDADILDFAQACPHLQAIHLTGSSVSGVGVKALLTYCAELRDLCLVGCTGVSVDAVELARSKGVRVKFNHDDHARGCIMEWYPDGTPGSTS